MLYSRVFIRKKEFKLQAFIFSILLVLSAAAITFNVNEHEAKGSSDETAAEMAAFDPNILAENDEGDEVTSLQKKLFNAGYDVTVNGTYDAETTEAIKKVQASVKLKVTGTYTKFTKDALSDAEEIRNYDNIQAVAAWKKEEEQYFSALENKINKFLEGNINRVGFLFYDITTGKQIAINEDMVCVAASTYKVGMNVVAYDLVNSGELDLSSTIWYNSGYYESGTGVLQNQISATLANPVPIQKLLDYSIIYSDNIATNMVSGYLGGANYVRAKVSSITGVTGIDTTRNVITPEEEFLLLRRIYDNRDNTYYSHLISVMEQTIFHDRIDKYIPQEITAHKIGDYGSYTNDVGIIFTDKPYIFVMYTNGVSDADELIAGLSNLIYNEQLNR